MGLSAFFKASILALPLLSGLAGAVPTTAIQEREEAATSYWFANIERQGVAAFADKGYTVFRNVKDYGAVGDGVTDDTAAINKAIQDGPNRCIDKCDSRTATPALVYFPPGTYLVSTPIVQTYYTQIVGDAVEMPTIKATAGFTGMAVIDANPYYPNTDAVNWYINQNNFFRQIRNLIVDITQVPIGSGAGIHWQVAQATSLQNIIFQMNPDASEANKQKGLFIENGSGGFMSDLTFNGGGFGMDIGSQQFTIRNLTFNGCQTAMHMIWNWQFLVQDIKVNNARVGINMTSDTFEVLKVGSLILQDSKFSNVDIGISTLYKPSMTMTNNTLVIDNVDMSEGVPTAVHHAKDQSVLLQGNQVVKGYTQGRQYSENSGKAIQGVQKEIVKPQGLLTSEGKVFTRSKPQYEDVPVSKFVSVKERGAKGNGVDDDTQAIQSIFDSVEEGSVVYFDHGAYIITNTIKVPKNIKITGEMWPLLMATGKKFSEVRNPVPVFQIGQPGEVGNVEMSDLIFETKGPVPGAIMMEWNLAGNEPGSAAMWDVHFRIGGTAGTELQSDKCTKNPNVTTAPDDACLGTFMMLHLTKTASAYIENCWFWVADHELDSPDHNQINLYNGRGVLIESENPVWLWGTASEHSQLYNYQVSNAKNLFMGVIQTETAYMQGNPDATVPFPMNEGFLDPDFKASCSDSQGPCARTWGLRVTNSSDIFMYGGGLYSFFENYGQVCVDLQNCQENMISIEDSTVHLFGITTKASVNMITHDGRSVALDQDNRSTFGATVAKFETSGGPPIDDEDGADGSDSGPDPGPGAGSSSRVASKPSTAATTTTSGYPDSSPDTETAQPTGGLAVTSIPISVVESGTDAPSITTPTSAPTEAGTDALSVTTPASAPTAAQSDGLEDHATVTVTRTITSGGNCEATP